jgi:hypothetical protein
VPPTQALVDDPFHPSKVFESHGLAVQDLQPAPVAAARCTIRRTVRTSATLLEDPLTVGLRQRPITCFSFHPKGDEFGLRAAIWSRQWSATANRSWATINGCRTPP